MHANAANTFHERRISGEVGSLPGPDKGTTLLGISGSIRAIARLT